MHNYIKNTFHHGFTAGKEKGILDGELKVKIKVIIDLIKITEVDNYTIWKIEEIKEDENWIKLLRE